MIDRLCMKCCANAGGRALEEWEGCGGPKRCYLDCVLQDLVGCFCFLAIENNDAVNVGVQVLV